MEYQTSFVTPPKQDFDTVGFQGSMQQILQDNIGNYVIVDFLTGSNTLVSKQGILYNVSAQFLVLYDDINLRYVVCDIFSVKFVTFLLPGYRPGQVPSPVLADEEDAVREQNDLPLLSVNAAQQPAAVSPSDSIAAEQSMPSSDAPAPADEPAAAVPPEMAAAAMTPAQAAYQYAVRRRV